jgi:hypothetical protein
LSSVGFVVVDDAQLKWYDWRLDLSLVRLLRSCDVVVVLDPSEPDPLRPRSLLARVRNAFALESKLDAFGRSADVRGRLVVLRDREIWAASPGTKPPFVNELHRLATGSNPTLALFVLVGVAPLFGPLLMIAIVWAIASLVARAVDQFVLLHIEGRDVRKRLGESWHKWEHRVAAELDLAVVTARVEALQLPTDAGIVCLTPPQVAGLPLFDGVDRIANSDAPTRPSRANKHSSELKVWLTTSIGIGTLVSVATAVVVRSLARRRWGRRLLAGVVAMPLVVLSARQCRSRLEDHRARRLTSVNPTLGSSDQPDVPNASDS